MTVGEEQKNYKLPKTLTNLLLPDAPSEMKPDVLLFIASRIPCFSKCSNKALTWSSDFSALRGMK